MLAAAGGSGLLPSSRASNVVAAFDAATVDSSRCDAVHLRPPASGLPAGGATLRVGSGVGVLRPLDVRVSLGGPLPLLPLLDSLARPYAAAASGGSNLWTLGRSRYARIVRR